MMIYGLIERELIRAYLRHNKINITDNNNKTIEQTIYINNELLLHIISIFKMISLDKL